MKSSRGQAANGRRLYEIEQASPAFVRKAGEILQERFGFRPMTQPVVGLEAVITSCTKGEVTLCLGWDIWLGFYAMADSPSADQSVDDFGDYLDSILSEPEIQAYRQQRDEN